MIIKYTKYFFFLTFMLFFLTKAHASNEYFKCPEKISNILKGEHSLIKIGSVLGNNYINFHKSSPTKKKRSSVGVSICFFNKSSTDSLYFLSLAPNL